MATEDKMSVEELDNKFDYFDNISDQHLFKTIWSVYEVEDINDLAFTGTDLILRYSHHWGEETLTRALPSYPTWLDMWKAANSLINESGDDHHIFIEDFVLDPETKLIELYTGS
jgi:hypothetical protein